MHTKPRLEELGGLMGSLFLNVYTITVGAPMLAIIALSLLLSRKFTFAEALLEVSMKQS
jgi:hypothetical protein